MLKETDLLTLTLNNTGWGSKLFEVILEVIFRSKVSSIILLDDEFDRQNALMLLKAKEGIQDFHIHQNFFWEGKFLRARDFGKNLVIGLVCGKLNTMNGLLLRFNSDLHNLKKVWTQITVCFFFPWLTGASNIYLPTHFEDRQGR